MQASGTSSSSGVMRLPGWCLLLVGCLELSPFETDLGEDERNLTAKNRAKLAALSPPTSRFRFAVVSDSHQYVDELSEIVEQVNARTELAFLVHLGDMTDMGLREEYRAVLGALERLKIPFLTVIGNHDAISNGKRVYRRMFGPYDYAFDFGFARLLAFNSNVLEFGDVPDRAWLELASRRGPELTTLIGLSHQPSREPSYAEVLKAAGATALVTGHRHTFSLDWDGTMLAAAVAEAHGGQWLIAQVEPGRVSIESCIRESCVAVEP